MAGKKAVNLAVFGPGRGRPYFEKRALTVETIRQEFPNVQVEFYMIDDLVAPVTRYEDYVKQLRPKEIEQIEWADVILLLVTHHRLTAFVEFLLAREAERESGRPMMAKAKDVFLILLYYYQTHFERVYRRIERVGTAVPPKVGDRGIQSLLPLY